MAAMEKSNGRLVLGTIRFERVPLDFFLQPRFGQYLLKCRKRRKLDVRSAAREASIPTPTFSRIERGGDTFVTTAIQLTGWMLKYGNLDEVYGSKR